MTVFCPSCGQGVSAADRFCRGCGRDLAAAPPAPHVCAACGESLYADDRFCPGCGATATGSAAPSRPASGAAPFSYPPATPVPTDDRQGRSAGWWPESPGWSIAFIVITIFSAALAAGAAENESDSILGALVVGSVVLGLLVFWRRLLLAPKESGPSTAAGPERAPAAAPSSGGASTGAIILRVAIILGLIALARNCVP